MFCIRIFGFAYSTDFRIFEISFPSLILLITNSSIGLDQIAWIGLRDVDPLERKIIDKFDMNAFSMHDIDLHGIKNVLDMALKAVDPE